MKKIRNINDLEKKLEQEKEERLKQNQDTLGNIQNRLTTLEEAYKQEKIDREEGEKEIIRNINDNVYELNSKLDREKEDRNTKMKISKAQIQENLKKVLMRGVMAMNMEAMNVLDKDGNINGKDNF